MAQTSNYPNINFINSNQDKLQFDLNRNFNEIMFLQTIHIFRIAISFFHIDPNDQKPDNWGFTVFPFFNTNYQTNLIEKKYFS